MLDYQVEPLFSYRVGVTPPTVVGPVPGGIRVDFGFSGGTVFGPKLNGKVLPGGGDFALIRDDGVLIVDVRGLLQSDDGAVIEAAYTGVLDLGPDGHGNFLKGVMPPALNIRAAPRFRTAHPAYQWLNRLQCFSVGIADLGKLEVLYEVYALR